MEQGICLERFWTDPFVLLVSSKKQVYNGM